jgi:thiol-disulfide isomerase/thioredoxin
LADLRGKVVLLDFWATWCGVCDEEIPVLERLQTERNPSDLVLLGVSDEDAAVVHDWLKENHRSFQTLAGAKKAFEAFGIDSIPALTVVDRHGIVTSVIWDLVLSGDSIKL